MADARQTIALFVSHFVQRCAAPTTKEAGDDYRQLFGAFVEDVLEVLDLPEWPSAPLVCFEVWNKLLAFIPKKDTEQPVPLAPFAMKMLGQVLGRYVRAICALYGGPLG